MKSPAFEDGQFLPAKYTCEGSSTNPPLIIEKIPSGTKTIALIIEDHNAEIGTFDQWVIWNIPPLGKIDEQNKIGTEGLNSMAEHTYIAPCPSKGTHNYHFKVYALDTMLNISTDAGKTMLIEAMRGHIIARGDISGRYRRTEQKKAKLTKNKGTKPKQEKATAI